MFKVEIIKNNKMTRYFSTEKDANNYIEKTKRKQKTANFIKTNLSEKVNQFLNTKKGKQVITIILLVKIIPFLIFLFLVM